MGHEKTKAVAELIRQGWKAVHGAFWVNTLLPVCAPRLHNELVGPSIFLSLSFVTNSRGCGL